VNRRDAWEAHAEDWIAWARSKDHDHFFWRFSAPALLDVVPGPGRLTLDLACGEGRMARQLHDRGHTVLAVDSSPTLVRAARKAAPRMEVLRADLARMPLGDGIADLAVSSMALMDVDDLEGSLREVARVLLPGGWLCASITHPAQSVEMAPHYFVAERFDESMERGGLEMTFASYHRPLSAYTNALAAAGFVIERLEEPVPAREYVSDHPEAADWRRQPTLVVMRARREP
jgi:ubiquinone/menaquinone biosynthesis C-methylase UbiE